MDVALLLPMADYSSKRVINSNPHDQWLLSQVLFLGHNLLDLARRSESADSRTWGEHLTTALPSRS